MKAEADMFRLVQGSPKPCDRFFEVGHACGTAYHPQHFFQTKKQLVACGDVSF